ncbi:UNVERIFIED_CONTAM: hypothetical protein NCL1_18729 [Trichonephila clavipes]
MSKSMFTCGSGFCGSRYMESQRLVYFGAWNPNFELNPRITRNSRTTPDYRIFDTSWQGFTLKAVERESMVPCVPGNGQSESDIPYKKLSQLYRIMPDDSILEIPW